MILRSFLRRRNARVLATRKLRAVRLVALFCVASFGGAIHARDYTQISPILPPMPPPVPLSAAQVPAPPNIDAKTARFHAAKLFNLGQVRAPAWILMDADSGRVLAGHNERARMFPASTTKTMTALVAISEGDLNGVVRIGPNPPKTGEQSAYLMEGEQFALRDLVRAALIKSANDACVAVAEGVAGNVPDFVARMNAKAKEVGATDTHFANPHGLHDPHHYTTPRDLALIARAAMRYPFFNETTRTREAEIHGNWKIGGARTLVNKNRLLFRWAACDGVKTGYTKQAGNCLIASATKTVRDQSGKPRDFRLIAVVMHSPNTWSDAWFALQKLGFDRFRPDVLARENEVAGEADVAGGAVKAQAIFAKAIEVPVRFASTRGDVAAPITKRLEYLSKLKAPLARGQILGSATFFQNGIALIKAPLVCAADVPQSTFASAFAPSSNFPLPNLWMPIALSILALSSLAFFVAAWRQHKPNNERTRTTKRK